MRVAFDARTILDQPRRGIGKTLLTLYRHMARLKPDWRFFAFHRSHDAPVRLLHEPNIEPIRIEMPGDRVDAWQRWRLPIAAWRHGADVLHCPANTSPGWCPIPLVVTIHDLIPLLSPETVNPVETLRFEQGVRSAARRAARVICPSRYTASVLRKRLAVPHEQIEVVPWAVDDELDEIDVAAVDHLMARYDLDGPFVLHFGASDPRKNTQRVLEAWALIEPYIRRRVRLMVVGLTRDAVDRFGVVAQRLGVGDEIRCAHFLPDADVNLLLAASTCLVYPSLAEGFGMPLLEAFAAGTPALASDRTSLPEVAGDACCMVDPEDVVGISRALRNILRDGEYRATLQQRGKARLAEYSWERSAEATANVLTDAAGTPAQRAA